MTKPPLYCGNPKGCSCSGVSSPSCKWLRNDTSVLDLWPVALVVGSIFALGFIAGLFL